MKKNKKEEERIRDRKEGRVAASKRDKVERRKGQEGKSLQRRGARTAKTEKNGKNAKHSNNVEQYQPANLSMPLEP